MYKVRKKAVPVCAYRLGDMDPAVKQLIAEGKVSVSEDGQHFEVFSQEAVKSGCGRGELAAASDYIKIDSTGYPYPNSCDFFERNHKHISGNKYQQVNTVLRDAWSIEEPMCKEIEFLINRKGLVIDEEHPDQYFSARLWGTCLSAARDAVILFYRIDYEEGTITDVDYAFVSRNEFEKTYEKIVEEKRGSSDSFDVHSA